MRRGWLVVAALGGVLTGAAAGLSVPAEHTVTRDPEVEPEARALPVVGPAPLGTLLAWTPGGLPPDLPEQARRVPGIDRVAVVRSGTAWMTGWGAADGIEQQPPSGMALPVEVAAVEPQTYQGFVGPVERASISALSRGGAVLGRTGARLRGIGPGGRIEFGETGLRVSAVLADELVGAHEVIVSRETGARLEITRPRYLLIHPDGTRSRERIESALRRNLPRGTRMRVRGPGETPVFRHGDAVLPPVRLKELFGEFAARPGADGALQVEPGWTRAHIRTVRLPILGRASCHRALIAMLRSALREIERRHLEGLLDPGDFGGCYSPRFANRDPSSGLSHHAWGVAFDVNVSENPLGGAARLDRRLVAIFERWGFTWGGHWLVPDAMHLEFLTYP